VKKLLFTLLALCATSMTAYAAETLTVYTYESFVAEWGPGPKVKQAFEKECGCSLNWVAVTDGVAMLNAMAWRTRISSPPSGKRCSC
jgi:thiamine transport system substrate-binding protein